MREKKLQDLSSAGWSRMRQVKRDLDDKKISTEDAISEFLKERDFRISIGRDRHAVDDLRRMFK
jgi:hypothetical protein